MARFWSWLLGWAVWPWIRNWSIRSWVRGWPAWKWVRRWQEPVLWLPALSLLAVAGWVVLGALDPDGSVSADIIAALTQVPVLTVKAVAALGLAWFARRRWRHRLTVDQKRDYWDCLMAGMPGALVVFVFDTVVFLACVALLLRFFSR